MLCVRSFMGRRSWVDFEGVGGGDIAEQVAASGATILGCVHAKTSR